MMRSTLFRHAPATKHQAVWYAGLLAAIGVLVVVLVRAATWVAVIEAESGTIGRPAAVTANGQASGGKMLAFGSAIPGSTPAPTAVPTPTATPAVTPTPAPASFPLRLTFYYPWFPETWGSPSNPFTNYHPSAGYYSSDDTARVNTQIQQMTYAGFDGAVASWWGQNTHSEATRIPALLNNANNGSHSKQLRWALYYEKESVGDPSAAELANDLTYIKTRYTSNANYLKINGRPVLFVFEDGNDGCAMAYRWSQANANLNFYIVLKVFSNYTFCPFQPAGWHQYAPANARDSQTGYAYTISPGFWLKGEAAPRLNRDPARWATDIDAMIASHAPFQLVTTFNEWGEGTATEPASEWSSASGYGAYLDALHAKLNPGH